LLQLHRKVYYFKSGTNIIKQARIFKASTYNLPEVSQSHQIRDDLIAHAFIAMQEMSTAAQTQSPNSLEGMPNEILQLILYYAIRDNQHVWSTGTHLRTFHAIAELGTHIEEVLLK
jgi:hypothetical protein